MCTLVTGVQTRALPISVHALTSREISVTPANPFSEFRKMAFAGPHAAGWSRGNADWRPRADRIVQSLAVPTMGAIAGRVQGAGYANEEITASLALFQNLMLHPRACGGFSQPNWQLPPTSHRSPQSHNEHE